MQFTSDQYTPSYVAIAIYDIILGMVINGRFCMIRLIMSKESHVTKIQEVYRFTGMWNGGME